MTAIDQDTVRRELRGFIHETFMFGDEDESFADSDSFLEKGIIDSTGVLELTAFLEQAFWFTVEDDELVRSILIRSTILSDISGARHSNDSAVGVPETTGVRLRGA